MENKTSSKKQPYLSGFKSGKGHSSKFTCGRCRPGSTPCKTHFAMLLPPESRVKRSQQKPPKNHTVVHRIPHSLILSKKSEHKFVETLNALQSPINTNYPEKSKYTQQLDAEHSHLNMNQ